MSLNASEMFKVLGVDTRVRIIELLKSEGPLGAKKIAEVLGITAAAVSQHLKILKQAGLVTDARRGYWIPYSIDENALEHCRCLLDQVCACGCHSSVGISKQKVNKATLKTLLQYEKELKSELQNVRARISELRTKKK